MAVTELVPPWMKEICQSYEGDTWARVQLSKFKEGTGTYSLCTEGVLGQIYVGTGGAWSERI